MGYKGLELNSPRRVLKMKRLLLTIAAFTLCWTQVSAQTLYVPSGEYSTIQSAIDDANNDNTIVVSAGIYKENINFLGKAITVRSVDPNDPNMVAATIIDGSNPVDPNVGSVVTFNSGEDTNSVLSGFTITGGTGSWILVSWEFQGLRWNRCGGGVLCYNMSAPTISKNIFTSNTAGQGGGIYLYGNPVNPNNPSNPPMHISPVITDNTFVNNTASAAHGFPPPNTNYPNGDHGDGGAIVSFQGCDAIIKENLIQGNYAQMYGGGLHLRQWSNGLIEDNDIIGNHSALGAGIHVTYTSSPNIVDNLIQANIAGGLGGGGIYVYYYSNPLIERNTITQNESANGAGILVAWTSNPTIRNNMIVNNVNGAGIRVKGDSIPIITNNTIVGNTAPASYGGGVDCFTDSAPIIENNIIASNGNSFGIYALTTPPVIRYNDVWDNAAGNYNSVIGDQTGINGNISVAPNFVNSDSNDYHLNYNSNCMNAGDSNFVPATNETDYDGNQRLLGQRVDMGADEVLPVWNFTSGNQYETIQQAINDANDYDIIVVIVGTHTGTGNKNIDFGGKAITLRSLDPNNPDVVASTIIDCQGSGRGFRFHSGEDTNSIVNGLTITNGGNTQDGGAIHCSGSSPAITNCIIRDNITNGHGAGIYCGYNSNPIITNCFINSNTFTPSGYGGGIYCYKSSPIITNCIITNNSATGSGRHGGGICFWGDQDAGSDAIVANCIISGNSAGHRGGGLYAYWSSPTFVNCTVIGNMALEGGGIGSFRESNPAVINCIVRDNIAPDGNQLALISTLRVWPTFFPTEMTVSFSDIEGGQSDVCIDDNMILHWGDGNINIDPNFVDPGYWDDANTPADPNDDFFITGNYHLLPISGCIDVGDNLSVPPESTTDIDGEQRIFNDTVDMGADEVVTNLADFNTDGIVDYLDIEIMTNEWLSSGGELQSDLFDDDFIDFADYAVFAEQWLWTATWHQ
jgi:parallel beta-helix repeat protein